MSTDLGSDEYGFPDDDDGPDITQARRSYENTRAKTDEIEVIVREHRAVVREVAQLGRDNHFIQKWRSIIGGAA